MGPNFEHDHFGGHRRMRGEGFGWEGKGRMRRGDIRTAVLAVLAEQPRHGYEVIQALEEKTDGAWRPSAGSVYPTLQLLEDEGLARSSERDGKRVYELTGDGQGEAAKRIEAAGGPPWATTGRGGPPGGLRAAVTQLGVAARQVAGSGNPALVEQAVTIVTDARKQLYRLLADA
jgi:DNA-binding PadR family transcriptional regulator